MSTDTTATRGPLSGYRILDFTVMTAGPVATMLLGDLGADVIKVEEFRQGDLSRNIGTHFVGGESRQFMSENRNKRSVRVDLKQPAARELILRLARQCDVVAENFRPGTLARLGLGYDDIRAVKPDIVYASVSAFGQDGPMAGYPANDPIIQAQSGLMAMTGQPDGPPTRIGNPYPDFGGAMLLALGVVAALLHRERTGEGQYLDTSLLEGATFATIPRDGETLASGKAPPRMGTASAVFMPYQTFTGGDGGEFFLSCFTEKFWSNLCDALERPDWKTDPRFATNPARCEHRTELERQLAGHFARLSTDDAVALMQRHNVPVAKVQDLHQALREDPQLRHRGMVVPLEHPVAGTLETLRNPLHLAGTPARYDRPPPMLGEHTEAVLGELGLGETEIGELMQAGVVGGLLRRDG